MSAITYQSVNYREIRVTHLSFFPLVSLSFKMSDCEQMKFHCLCIYSLWSRDYRLYKVIQTDEWILYWLKCKYGHILGSPVTQLEVQQLSSLSFIVSQRSKSVFLKLLIKLPQPPSGSGDLGEMENQKMRCWYWFYNLKQRAPFSLY